MYQCPLKHMTSNIRHLYEVNTFSCKDGTHDDIIEWKLFPRYWPFVRGILRSLVNYPHNGQWRWALMFSLICVWINSWVNNREAGDLRRHRAHYDVIVMSHWNGTLLLDRKYKDYVYRKMLVQEYLKKWRIFKRVKSKNDMMYHDIYNCICQNTKK